MIGSARSADALRIQRFLGRNGHPFLVVDPDVDAGAQVLLENHGAGLDDTPVVLCGASTVLVRPTNAQLGDCLGISEPLDPVAVADVAIVGAGPAGLAAAVYAASEGLDTVVLESEAPGGQAGTSSRIENYLGFPTGISGQALAGRAQVQAQKFGARIAVPRRVERLHVDERPYTLDLDDGTSVRSRTVVIATGARYRRLDHLENLHRFEGNGVHYAATAIEAGLCEGEEVVVGGGGNSAGQAAIFLSRTTKHVHMLIRGESLASSMSSYLVGRIEAVPDRITLHRRTEMTRLAGDRHLESVTWRDRSTGREETRPIANVFLMLGAVPNTGWLGDAVALNEDGFVRSGVSPESTGAGSSDPDLSRVRGILETSRPGVYAIGDVRADSVKRVASAVGEGSIVVSSVHQRLAGA